MDPHLVLYINTVPDQGRALSASKNIIYLCIPEAAADGNGEVEDAQHQRPLTFTVPNNKDCAHQQKDRRTNQKDDIPLRVNQVKMAALALLPVL